MSNNPDGITQSNSGSMSGGMQAAIGNQNKQTMSSEGASSSDMPTQAEIVELLVQIQQIIQQSELPEIAKGKIAKYVETAKVEAEEKEPDKQLVSKNLERVTKSLEEIDKTVDTSKRVFGKVVPLLVKVASWIGAAAQPLLALLP